MVKQNYMNEVGYKKPPKQYQWKKGQSGNPKGKAKGSKSLAVIVRKLEEEDFNWDLVPVTGISKEKAKKIGAPWKAIVFTALAKAYSGDVKAMEWLRKSGYGDKLDITSGGKEIVQPLIISTIEPRNVTDKEEATVGSEPSEQPKD